MLDFHAHVLPGVDHGCPSQAHMLTQLEAARDAGVTTLCATSHFYAGRDNLCAFLRARDAAFAQLDAANRTGVTVLPGAEVGWSSELEQLTDLQALSIGQTGCLLLELPHQPWNRSILDSVMKLQSRRNLQLVIAHVDRYPFADVARLAELEVTFQINASSVCQPLGRMRTKKLLALGNPCVLGSDVHRHPAESYADFQKAVHKLDKDAAAMMEHGASLLA